MTILNLESEHGVTVAKRRTSEQLLAGNGPYTRLLFDLVRAAKNKGASDIHIEPTEFGVDLRLRVDGDLILEKQVDLEHRESLILEAKRVFGLAIGVSGRPQDGRASLPKIRLDLRVSLLPTHFGEKIVMRLLNLDATFAIDELGFLKEETEVLKEATRFENGVVIVSGPTGSGKTRTLYSLLKEVNPKRYNIVTLEDPIEYRIEGLSQVQVSSKMTFADALRAVLRQDPDVILVGEIRDAETAKLCFQAAETGHLVFSTVHANGAIEVIERLKGLGVDELILKSNLRLSIAQRLEQKICRACAIEIPETFVLESYHEEIKDLYPPNCKITALQKSTESWRCTHCRSGVSGRIPILEWASSFEDEETGERGFDLDRSLEDAQYIRMFRGDISCEGTDYEPNLDILEIGNDEDILNMDERES